jgi:hypothetical protein
VVELFGGIAAVRDRAERKHRRVVSGDIPACRHMQRLFEQWIWPEGAMAWAALAALGLGPVGAAFLLWDIGMKQGDVSLLGVLSYAALSSRRRCWSRSG